MSIIKDLKDNKMAFGLMPQEMQDKAKEIGGGHFLRLELREWRKGKWVFDSFDRVYRLLPDYTDEPAVIEIDTLATFFCPHCLKKINATFKKEVK